MQHPKHERVAEEGTEELPRLKDPERVTEHNILVLLSRVSYAGDPSEHLINRDCLLGLINYITAAREPFPRCGRILAR